MYSRVETITPELALKYLEHNRKNRVLRPSVVKRYANDMLNGYWQLTPQGISFYENGDLADGQHRLNAVVHANIPVEFQVTYGVAEDCTIQDRVIKRSTSDVLHLAGVTSSAATTNGIAAINYLFVMANNHGVVSDTTIKKFLEDGKNEELICESLAISNVGSNKMQLLRKAPIIAGIYCALYCGVPKECLYSFAKIANSGFTDSPKEQAAIVLRNYMIQNFTNKNTAERRFAFVVATNAIKDFASGTPRQKVYKSNTDPAFWKYVKKSAMDKFVSK